MSITIGEIAQMAGVSKSTVSRVLNSSGYVHEETRDRVEQIMREHNYFPSAAAQSLSRQETNTIGVIIPEWGNTFFTEVLEGVSDVLDNSQMTMILTNTANDGQKEREALRMMEMQRVKGVIFTPANGYTDEEASRIIRRQLKDLKVPVVVVDREIENVRWDGVFYENFQSTYLAVERLLGKGHKEIGIITGDMNLKHGRERYAGYAQALEDNDLPVPAEYTLRGNFTVEKAYELTKGMFASGKWPTGMVLCNNQTTLGFLKAVTECNKALGKDIDFVGIDHIPVLDLIGFHYDCVTRDAKKMGRMAMELLLDRFENPDQDRKNYMIPCIPRFNGQDLPAGRR